MSLLTEVSHHQLCVIVKCSGTLTTDLEIDNVVESSAIDGHKYRLAVVDLRDLQGVDVTCLGTLWLRYMKARAEGWRVCFVNLPDSVRSLLELHSLDDAFEIHSSLERAVRALQSQPRPLQHRPGILRAS